AASRSDRANAAEWLVQGDRALAPTPSFASLFCGMTQVEEVDRLLARERAEKFRLSALQVVDPEELARQADALEDLAPERLEDDHLRLGSRLPEVARALVTLALRARLLLGDAEGARALAGRLAALVGKSRGPWLEEERVDLSLLALRHLEGGS